MAVCPNCKSNNVDDAKFCANCGVKMPDASATPVAPVPPVMTAEPAKKGNPQHNGKAIAGLILGIASMVFCWLWFIALPVSVVGIVMSAIGLKSQKSGVAVGGLVTSILGFILMVIILFVIGITILNSDWFNFNFY
jgi:hypothetical protein